MNSTETDIKQFEALGERFSLIPLLGKQPVEKKWQKWCSEKRKFIASDFEGRNAGIACGPASGVIVLDIDSVPKFTTISKERGWTTPPTRIHETGSGNPHFFYAYPNDGKHYGCRSFKDSDARVDPKTGKASTIFDIKGLGGQVVAPGSVHPNTGKLYTVRNDVPIAPPPMWLLELALNDNSEETVQTRSGDHWNGDLDSLRVSYGVKKLIREGESKGRRSEAIMSVVSNLVFAGYSNDVILAIFEKYPIGEKYLEKGQTRQKWLQNHIKKIHASSPFFEGNKFIPTRLVNYLIEKEDILHDGNSFYIYHEKGVWKRQHDSAIGKKIMDALGRRARKSYILDTMKLTEYQTYKDDKELESNPELINLANGMLDIRNGKLKPHDKSYYSKVQIPIEFDPHARCPVFQKYLQETFKDDHKKALAVQDFGGYSLYHELHIHKCLFLLGDGANGKSTLINTLTKIAGSENVAGLHLNQLLDKFLIGYLKDKLLNVSSEVQTKSLIEANIFKQVISGDLIQADVKFRTPFTFRPIAKHIFSMNEIPVIRDRTFALERRLIVVKFNQRFTEETADIRLEEKITKELSGILNWCLEGLYRVLRNGKITESTQMKRDKKEFIKYINPVLSFVEEDCKLVESLSIGKSSLYQAYGKYCNDSGIRALSKMRFYHQLLADFSSIKEIRPNGGARLFQGIRLTKKRILSP